MKKDSGFTVLELMVAVAIVGILAGIAMPQYKNYLIRAKRADTVMTLHNLHKIQLAFFASEDTFVVGNAGSPDYVNSQLGFSSAGFTDQGYEFSNYAGNMAANGNAVGYYVALVKNLDPDPAQDVFVIKYNWNENSGTPDGVALMANDDLTNLSCVQICFPF